MRTRQGRRHAPDGLVEFRRVVAAETESQVPLRATVKIEWLRIVKNNALRIGIALPGGDVDIVRRVCRSRSGESIAHFLFRRSLVTMSSVNRLDVSLDGQPAQNVLHYRFISEQPFVLRGDASLATELNACITGGWQAASADGFFMLFRPLSPGAHTIVVRGPNTFGDDKTYRYYPMQR